ncbi:MAG TPA: histidine phosphotransferase family protein [Caulobacterales bacterium]|jgi:histidine phosphotransferase ChpT|nr:histidine phosphotransferase family protein [Caulobacterales bacterium]
MEQARLTELVASKLCHDFMGPMTAMMHGLELLKQQPSDAEALSLLENGVVKAHAKLDFYRHALGGALGGEGEAPLSSGCAAAQSVFATFKAKLDWQAPDLHLPRAVIRVVLNVLMIANDCLPKGGTVTLALEDGELRVIAVGERMKLKADTAAGLAGNFSEDGYQGLNPQPFLTALLARQAGVELVPSESPERIEFALRGPLFAS